MPANAGDAPSLGWEDPLGKEMATHSSILVWENPWTEEPGGLQSMRSQKTGHNLVTKQEQSLVITYFSVAPHLTDSTPSGQRTQTGKEGGNTFNISFQ